MRVAGRAGLCGPRVDEHARALSIEGAQGWARLGVVEVAAHDDVGVGVRLEDGVNLLAQEDGLLLAHLGLGRRAHGALRLEVGGEQEDVVAGRGREGDLGKAAAGAEASAVEEVGIVRVGASGAEREAREDGDGDVGIMAADELGMGQGEAACMKAGLKVGERVVAADLLEGNDVGVQVREEFRDLVSAGNGLGAASGCGLDEVVLGVEGCDAESCLGEGLGWGEGLEEGEAQEDLGRQHGGGEPG